MKTFKELQTKLAEDQYSAEYKIKYYVDPVTGENKTRKIRPHRVTFANSKMGGEPVQQDDMKEGYVSANSAPDIQPQMNEGKMGQIHADIEDHLGKHLSNYKKMGGSEHFGNKTVEAAKKISKAHGIAQHHAQKLVNDYVDSALKESDESWAAAMEKQKHDRLTDKDRGTLGKVADMMAKEKAKREFDLKMKKAQNSQRVAKALGEEVELDEAAAAGLAAKAKKSGVPLSTLKTVYKRGVAAWNSGHRPGTTPQQWGMARVNSYITKGKGTYHGADKDLREEELHESGGPVVWKKDCCHIEKYGDNAFALYVNDKKQKMYTSLADAKSASEKHLQEDSRLNKSGYHKGLSVATAKARVAHWKKMDKLSDRDPRAYEPAPGDKTAKTTPSVHTKKYHAMYGEEKKEDLPFTPDKPKNPVAKAGKYGQGYSTARHLARQAMKKMTKEDLDEAVDKEHPIYKEYQALRKMSIKDLRNHIKQQHRIVDTSEFRTKEHAASHIINTKHGNKRVKAVFGEETEQIEEISKELAGKYLDKVTKDQIKTQGMQPNMYDKLPANRQKGVDNAFKRLKEENIDEAYRLPSDSEIDKVKAHVKANHPNKSLAQVAVHRASKKIEYVVKDKDGKMTGHTLGEEVEQIDELSKDTLNSYVHKAFAQGNDLHYDLAHSRGDKATDAERAAMKAKLSKRNTGIIKAAKKLREDDKVYDEKWKKYVGKSFKKATE